jgi:protein-disulfide isomerase
MKRLSLGIASMSFLVASTLTCPPLAPALAAPTADLAQLVLHDPESPVGGNPNGDVTIVAFLDYNCPFCRRSTPQLNAFLATDPNVRLVYKDWPILSEASVTEAKVALAARYQNKYREAHDALMAITIRPASTAAVKTAMKSAGLDIDRLNKDLAAHNDDIDALLKRDEAEAEALGFQGTPVFLIGPFKMAQELDEGGFRQVVADARARLAAATPPQR